MYTAIYVPTSVISTPPLSPGGYPVEVYSSFSTILLDPNYGFHLGIIEIFLIISFVDVFFIISSYGRTNREDNEIFKERIKIQFLLY